MEVWLFYSKVKNQECYLLYFYLQFHFLFQVKKHHIKFNKLYSLHDKLNNKLKSDTIIIQTNEDIIKNKQIKNNSNISIHLKKKAIKYIIDNKDIKSTNNDFKFYPSYNNSEFVNEIKNKCEFTNNIQQLSENICDTNEFELAPHQIFLKNFMSNDTPYKSLLIYHSTGVGKTCSGVSIAENFRNVYSDNRIIILASKNIIDNWKQTIFNISKGTNQCTSDTYLSLLQNKNLSKNKQNITQRDISNVINKYYEFYGYREFANKINNIFKEYYQLNKEKDIEVIKYKAIKEYFSDRVLIIDEVHNIRTTDEANPKDIIDVLTSISKYSNNLRMILLTATPMYNEPTEIIWLINLMLLNDKRNIITEKDIFKDDKITKKGKEILTKKIRGYITHMRGENPNSFPLRFIIK